MSNRAIAKQALLPFDRHAKVVNRQIRQRFSKQKVTRGPGRPPKRRGGVKHQARPVLPPKSVLHVTIKARAVVPSLRRQDRFLVLSEALRRFSLVDLGATHGAFRVVHFSIQTTHAHLVIEADSREALSKGMQKLVQSMARRLNRLFVTTGKGWLGRIFAERYHAHHLETPSEVRFAIAYVLNNFRKHLHSARIAGKNQIDPFSSASSFDGFRRPRRPSRTPDRGEPTKADSRPLIQRAQTWLLTVGWRRLGLIDHTAPGHHFAFTE